LIPGGAPFSQLNKGVKDAMVESRDETSRHEDCREDCQIGGIQFCQLNTARAHYSDSVGSGKDDSAPSARTVKDIPAMCEIYLKGIIFLTS